MYTIFSVNYIIRYYILHFGSLCKSVVVRLREQFSMSQAFRGNARVYEFEVHILLACMMSLDDLWADDSALEQTEQNPTSAPRKQRRQQQGRPTVASAKPRRQRKAHLLARFLRVGWCYLWRWKTF